MQRAFLKFRDELKEHVITPNGTFVKEPKT